MSCLPANFVSLPFATYPALSSLRLQENVYERIRLYYESSSIVEEIWSQFNIVRFGKAYLTSPLSDIQIAVFRPKKKVKVHIRATLDLTTIQDTSSQSLIE
eukprot:TRINITY_DN64_c0_g2_i2.p2 TRINITY_DN64_c0_g2~~TRINITY_DN64_c0_g2_i2.p2  ORF type:complete len:101 (-),score=0.34 TRINITY_DN64_c0_g2_i2:707-1009(-)